MLIAWLSVALMAAAIIFSFRFGQSAEKFGGVTIGFMLAATWLHDLIFKSNFAGLDVFGFAIDLIGFAGFFAIALFALRIWPLWASALQLIALCAHLVHELQISINPMAYALMRFSPTSLASLALLAGTVSLQRRPSASANRGCWQDWSALSNPKGQRN